MAGSKVPNPPPPARNRAIGLVVVPTLAFTSDIAEAVRSLLSRDYPETPTVVMYRAQNGWWPRFDHQELGGVIGFLGKDDYEALQGLNVPVVNTATALSDTAPSVITDHHAIGEMAAEYFLDLAYRQMAMIAFGNESHSAARFAGFREAAEAVGADVWFDTWFGELGDWLERVKKQVRRAPLGICATSDVGAGRLIEVMTQHGMQVPEQVGVLGINNGRHDCEMRHPTLSSIDIDPERIGAECVRMLMQLLGGQPLSRRLVRVKPRGVVERLSTQDVAYADPEVRRAVRLIRERRGIGLYVEDIMTDATISRRTMEMRFREHVGHTIRQEIERQRLAEARRLLADSQLPVGEIADRCGFGVHSRFSALFRERFNMTPSEYRDSVRAF